MSSGAILASMQTYQTKLEQLQTQIAALKGKIEAQHTALQAYSGYFDIFFEELQTQQTKASAVAQFHATTVLALQHQTKADDILGSTQRNLYLDKLEMAEGRMKAEMRQNQETLLELERQQTMCQNTISHLSNEYNLELAREAREAEEARQAAAAAQAAQTARPAPGNGRR